ncbi:MAG: hypothetical protein ABJE10_01985 [bacterium]
MTPVHGGSPGDADNWVDPVTNLAVLSVVDLKLNLGGVLHRQLPRHCFGPLVHEMTHHWCFHSAVGNALACLSLRIRRRAFLLDGTEASELALLDDIIRYDTAMEMLRPLAEGLALFAEFDMRPGQTKVRSQPMLWTWLLFTGRDSEHDEESDAPNDASFNKMDFDVFRIIYDSRLSAEFLARKENLLVQPLDVDAGGYLAGYLTLKQFWPQACDRSDLFEDADFFFAFMKSWFYDDYGLVATLLDPGTVMIDSGNAIAGYLHQRFNDFLAADLAPIAREFERGEERSTPSGNSFTEREFDRPLLTDEEIARAGRERHQALVSELTDDNPDPALQALSHMDAWTLAQRETMCLASVPARIETNSKNRVTVYLEEVPMLGGPGVDGGVPGNEDGTLQIFFSPTFGYVALVASIGDRIAFLHFLGDLDEEIQKQFLGYNVDSQAIIDIGRRSREAVANVLDDANHGHKVDNWRESLAKRVEALYAAGATLAVDAGQGDAVREAMRRTGVWKIVGRNADLVRALALVGLAGSVGALSRSEELFATHGLDHDASMQRLMELGERTGMRLVSRAGKLFVGNV